MELLVQYSREEDDELREYCLQACEAFVNKCPEPIHPHIPTVCSLILNKVKFVFFFFVRMMFYCKF